MSKRSYPGYNNRSNYIKRMRSQGTGAMAGSFYNAPRVKPLPGYRPSNSVRMYTPRTPGGQMLAERKYYDCSRVNTTVQRVLSNWNNTVLDGVIRYPGDSVDTGVLCLFAPKQGNDITEREARSVFVHNITIRGTVNFAIESGTTLTGGHKYRLILVLDKQTNGTQMGGEQLINSGQATTALEMFQNTANFGRFQILKDKMITLTNPTCHSYPDGSVQQQSMSRSFKLRHVFKQPLRINFNDGNSGTVADIVDNSIHFLVATANDTDPSPGCEYQCRTSFSG